MHKLKDERDRLVQISNELRAELNRTRRTVSEYKGLLQKPDGSKSGAARLVSSGEDGGDRMHANLGGPLAVGLGRSMFSFDERHHQSDPNVIKEDSKESQLSDSAPPSRREGHSRSPRNLSRNDKVQNFQEVQLEQQR